MLNYSKRFLNSIQTRFKKVLNRYKEKDNIVNYALFSDKKYKNKSMNIGNAIKYNKYERY